MAGPKLQKGGGAMAPAAPPVPTPMLRMLALER